MLKYLQYKIRPIFFLIIFLYFGLSSIPNANAQVDNELVSLADELFAYGDYSDALAVYLQATIENPDNVRANLMVGRCYLYTVDGKSSAVEFLLKAHELDKEVDNKIFYYIAEGYRHSHLFDESVQYYEKYLEELDYNRRSFSSMDVDQEKKKINRRISECENAKKYIANPVLVSIENLGSSVNSQWRDYSPILSADEKLMIFTSRRYGTTGGLKDRDVEYFEDIYYCERQGDGWGNAKNIGIPVNTNSHESALALSPDGDVLYIYNTENNGDIYYSEKKKGVWQKPKPLKGINTEHREEAMSITRDGKYLFFQSDRPGGFGETDIWRSERKPDGSWGKPEVLSNEINTEWDDASPYYDVNTNTLYFSSMGHEGMGGFDLYKSVYDEKNDKWSKPENLGYPINTTDDDHFFTLLSDGVTAYYSSFREDSYGSMDLYKIYPFTPEDKKEEKKEEPEEEIVMEQEMSGELSAQIIEQQNEDENEALVTIEKPEKEVAAIVLLPVKVRTVVKDLETGALLEANLEIVDKKSADNYFKGAISENGQVSEFTFSENKTLLFVAEAEGYQFASTNKIIEGNNTEDKEILVELFLRKPTVFQINVLRNIYFEFDKFTLTPSSYAELDKLSAMMQENPNMKIEIAGHADYIGSHDYNRQLSLKRAQSVRKYLTSKGINTLRISAKGYGETKPLASNDDEKEGRELNRRTEFIILQK